MSFVTLPLAIAGLIGMVIPIIIHLLARQRRRPVPWAAMRFLLEAYRKQRRRLQLEQLILLAVRCLLIAVLGLALARPILRASGVLDVGGSRDVYLVVDNGLASALRLADGRTALEHQVEAALGILKELEPGDSVGLITAAQPARGLIVPPSTDHSGAREALQALEARQTLTDLRGAMALLAAALQEDTEGRPAVAYLLSEFRAGSAPLDEPLPRILARLRDDVRLIAVPAAQEPAGNTQIVSIEPVRSVVVPGGLDGSGQVTVRLRRRGGALGPEVSRVRLESKDLVHVEPRVVQWRPGQAEAEVDFRMELATEGEREVALRAAIDDDALGADNERFMVIDSRSHIRVVLIDRRSFGYEGALESLSAGQWVRRALEPAEESPMEVIEVEPAALDSTDLRRSDVAILPRPDLLTSWSHLRRFIDRGGLLLVMPPGGTRVHQWTDHLKEDLGLPWVLGREVVEPEEPLTIDDQEIARDVLQLISSEISELVKPVDVRKVLPVLEHAQSRVVLALRDPQSPQESGRMSLTGSPLLLTGAPLAAEGGEGDDPAPAQGMVAYLAAAPELDWTNLPTRPLMVPLFHELVRQGLSIIRSARQSGVGPARSDSFPAPAAALVGPDGATVPIQGMRHVELGRSGLWRLVDAGGAEVGMHAVNVEPRGGASDTQPEAAVAGWLATAGDWEIAAPAQVGSALGRVESGAPVSRTLLLVLLALVILDALLGRWFSHAIRGRVRGLSGAAVQPGPAGGGA